ncbi:DUF6074 family protein [Consotaella aegiceratis]|uniref:DUF6074 family protein n=1 Tax=Consotaella aegiceratis TaxID=3097961 RepID=UPI002F4252E5
MQFDLFDQPKKPVPPKGPATLYAFPLARRKGCGHDIALRLARSSYDEGRAFWRAHVAELRKEMKAAGIPPKLISAEIYRYAGEVGRQARILSEYVNVRPENVS